MSALGSHGNVAVRRLRGRLSIVVRMRWMRTRVRMGGTFMARISSSSSRRVFLKTTLRYK